MDFRVLGLIGFVIVIITRIAISMLKRDVDVYNNNKLVQIVVNLLVIICLVFAGAIAAKWITGNVDMSYCTSADIILIIFITLFQIFCVAIIYYAFFCILGLSHFDKPLLHICFVVVFIFSIIGWSIPYSNYNRNIDKITKTIVVQKQERQLLYFCNIPVQEISGTISGSSFVGTGSVSGKITTTESIPYWYLNQNGEGIYNSVSAKSSKIVFIEDNKSPYVELISYANQTITINNNNGTEKIATDKTWTEYVFYLPKAIMQYNLN